MVDTPHPTPVFWFECEPPPSARRKSGVFGAAGLMMPPVFSAGPITPPHVVITSIPVNSLKGTSMGFEKHGEFGSEIVRTTQVAELGRSVYAKFEWRF